jgi:hypothetical protein
MAAIEDLVRFFQLPSNAPADLYLPQNGQTSQLPVIVKAGQGSSVGSVRTFNTSYTATVSLYCDQAAVEQEQ